MLRAWCVNALSRVYWKEETRCAARPALKTSSFCKHKFIAHPPSSFGDVADARCKDSKRRTRGCTVTCAKDFTPRFTDVLKRRRLGASSEMTGLFCYLAFGAGTESVTFLPPPPPPFVRPLRKMNPMPTTMIAPTITPRIPMPPLLPSAMFVLLQKKDELRSEIFVPPSRCRNGVQDAGVCTG